MKFCFFIKDWLRWMIGKRGVRSLGILNATSPRFLVALFLVSLIAVLQIPAIAQPPIAPPPIAPPPIAQPPIAPPPMLQVDPQPAATPQPATPQPPIAKQAEIRGVWMTSNDSDILMDQPKLEEAIGQLSRLHFNTLYPVVWNSGYVTYPSTVVQEAGIQNFVRRGIQGQDMLADLVQRAHRKNLLVIPWFEFGFMTPPTSELALNHPDWLTQQRDGTQTWIGAAGEVVWLNPFHPQVQKFITDLVLEVVTRYDIDGVQFDDHTSLPNVFGYDSYTRSLYQQETGSSPPSDPYNSSWVRWRADKITAFVRQLNKAVKEKKPNVIFSVTPNPYHVAYDSHLQDWARWVRDDLVDELIVQVYRDEMDFFTAELNRPEVKAAQKKIPTAVGILTGLRNRPVPMPFIQSKVRAARDRNLGVAFFFFESLWEYAPEPVAERQSDFLNLFPNPAVRSSI
ncbi:glycoside hydrolase family 10 protein [Lyngbya sp. CCY1209]|uniref:glycoside hydrolase family 10 protein n=1 Tax=Lyngbya sp. CCY1209 TaxID=2886103 RepID=UPI002D76C052|nr:glycoside hydrolase family 10 protein [Lyngbya sp. CCY1209]